MYSAAYSPGHPGYTAPGYVMLLIPDYRTTRVMSSVVIRKKKRKSSFSVVFFPFFREQKSEKLDFVLFSRFIREKPTETYVRTPTFLVFISRFSRFHSVFSVSVCFKKTRPKPTEFLVKTRQNRRNYFSFSVHNTG